MAGWESLLPKLKEARICISWAKTSVQYGNNKLRIDKNIKISILKKLILNIDNYKNETKMKRTINYLLVLTYAIALLSCVENYDDSFLRTEIDNIKEDISSLKTQVTTMQTVVDAFNEGKVITNVVEMSGGKGSKITFNDGTSIEIVNG